MQRFKTNIIIFGLAIVLSVSLFYITENTSLFSASVLSLQDAETIKAKSRDIGYKNEGNILDTFISQDLKGISSITLSVIYDSDNITLDTGALDSQTDYEIISDSKGEILIKFINFSNIDYNYNQSLFELPFTGGKVSMSTVLISQGSINKISGNIKNLSIGLLNAETQTHHK